MFHYASMAVTWRLGAILSALCAAGIAGLAQEQSPATNGPLVLLKCHDHYSQVSYRLVTPDVHKSIVDGIAKEARFWQKALNAAAAAWDADPATLARKFPAEVIRPKRVELVDVYRNTAQAEARLLSHEQKQKDEEDEDRKAAEEKRKAAGRSRRLWARLKARLLAEREEDALIRKAREETALRLFETKLVEIAGGELTAGDVATMIKREEVKKKKR